MNVSSERQEMIDRAVNFYLDGNKNGFDDIIKVLTKNELEMLWDELDKTSELPMTPENIEAKKEADYLAEHPELWGEFDFYRLLEEN